MDGLIWIAAVWTMALVVIYRMYIRRIRRWPIAPVLVLSMYLLLLGTESTDPTASGGFGVTTILRGFLASAALVFAIRALLVNGAAGRMRSGRRTNLLLLTAYAAYAMFSTLYSVSPIQTVGKAYELLVGVVIVWAIATSWDARAQLRAAIDLIVFLWAAMVLVAIPGYLVLPSLFVPTGENRPGFIFTKVMAAPYAHSNGLSAIGGMMAAYAVARALREAPRTTARRWWMALAGAGSVGILLASGRQGVIIWAVSVGVVLFLYARPAFVFLLIPTVAVMVQYFGSQLWSVLTRDQQEVTLYTLSGRLDFWEAAIRVWRESPLIGYGFGAGGEYALASVGLGVIGSLHSGYFEALVGVGIVGMLPLVIVVARSARWCWRRLRRGVEPEIAILIVPLSLHTVISLGFAAWLSSQFIVLALLAAYSDLTPEPGSRFDVRRQPQVRDDDDVRPTLPAATIT